MHRFPLSLILIFIGYNSIFCQAFRPSVFATLSGYRHTGFEDNLFTDFEVGLALSSKLWVTPQISYKNSGGDLKTQTIFQKNTAPLMAEEELRVSIPQIFLV